jgi:hypothetical protein
MAGGVLPMLVQLMQVAMFIIRCFLPTFPMHSRNCVGHRKVAMVG